jgi:hypothetical protein
MQMNRSDSSTLAGLLCWHSDGKNTKHTSRKAVSPWPPLPMMTSFSHELQPGGCLWHIIVNGPAWTLCRLQDPFPTLRVLGLHLTWLGVRRRHLWASNSVYAHFYEEARSYRRVGMWHSPQMKLLLCMSTAPHLHTAPLSHTIRQ